MIDVLVRYVGYGRICQACNRLRNTTHYILKQGETHLQEIYLCDDCQERGHVIRFRPIEERELRAVKQRRKNVKRSRKYEKDLATELDGETTFGSGNRDTKGDVRVFGRWRIEHKFTNANTSFSLKISDMNKVVRAGNMAGEWPAMIIDFRQLDKRYVVLPYDVFDQMREKLRDRDS